MIPMLTLPTSELLYLSVSSHHRLVSISRLLLLNIQSHIVLQRVNVPDGLLPSELVQRVYLQVM